MVAVPNIGGASSMSATVRAGDDLQLVATRVLPVQATAAVVGVDPARLLLERIGPEGQPALPDAAEDRVELVLGDDGLVMLGQAGEGFSSPRTLDAFPPSMIHVYVDDVEVLHTRATDAGAEVTDLETSPAGDRRFTATDPEGQLWVFAQRIGPASD